MNNYTPKRSLARPRPSLSSNTKPASTPNLNLSYKASALQTPALSSRTNAPTLLRKSSLSTLTSSSLATVPDASVGYGLTVLDEDSPTIGTMPPFTPSRGSDDDLEVGDLVDVPGSMHGTVKFIGTVNGKKGTFAGVELSEEFASRGKNNGDVDG
jgi:hypothetical protein